MQRLPGSGLPLWRNRSDFSSFLGPPRACPFQDGGQRAASAAPVPRPPALELRREKRGKVDEGEGERRAGR